jgi:predicted AlkP superfamily pyrophosphatase or phosphodiesterase
VGALCLLATRAPLAQPAAGSPKLAVLIVVDQMRSDYVERFQGDWSAGLKRLLTEGAWFTDAAFPYLGTDTCAGHATVATGAFPRTHGIVRNAWFDREKSALVPCTHDPDEQPIAYGGAGTGAGHSGSLLRLETLADRLRLARSAHVVSLSLKARSAIMLAGHGGDAVTWLSGDGLTWETSSAFSEKPVKAVQDFVGRNPIASDYGATWSRRLDEARYQGPDDGPGEAPPANWTTTFPHELVSESRRPDREFYARWQASPYANAYLGRFAAALAESMRLGQHEGSDLLAIGFSSPDLVGHTFGPDSHEVQDMFAHLDVSLGRLFERLDQLVGRDQYVVALGSDHGVAPIPEQLLRRGAKAGRLDVRAMSDAIERSIGAEIGPGRHVTRLNLTDVYLGPRVYERLDAKAGALDRVIGAVEAVPGVRRAFGRNDLLEHDADTDSVRRAAALSYVPERSGDIIIVPEPGWVWSSSGTNHGTASPDDQRVPILLMGRGVRHGRYSTPATPADVAPTLAALLGVALPRADGHVLREALSTSR